MTDIEIANSIEMKKIEDIASKLGIGSELIENYGRYKAKIDYTKINSDNKGKLVLVTAINPDRKSDV